MPPARSRARRIAATRAPAPRSLAKSLHAKDPTDTIVDWARTHGRIVASGLIVAAGIVGGVFLYRAATAKRVEQADAALVGPQQSIAAGNLALAQTDLKRILTRYAGTPAATQAAMLLAATYYDQKKYADGLAVLERAPTSGVGKPFATSVLWLIGDGYAQEGKYREAATTYERAASGTPFAGERDRLRAAAARAYVAAADTTAAVRIWTELAGEPQSVEGPEAHLRLGELTAKPAGKAAS
jgi:predicted negative regulator of RcsB-dependent stress response